MGPSEWVFPFPISTWRHKKLQPLKLVVLMVVIVVVDNVIGSSICIAKFSLIFKKWINKPGIYSLHPWFFTKIWYEKMKLFLTCSCISFFICFFKLQWLVYVGFSGNVEWELLECSLKCKTLQHCSTFTRIANPFYTSFIFKLLCDRVLLIWEN